MVLTCDLLSSKAWCTGDWHGLQAAFQGATTQLIEFTRHVTNWHLIWPPFYAAVRQRLGQPGRSEAVTSARQRLASAFVWQASTRPALRFLLSRDQTCA